MFVTKQRAKGKHGKMKESRMKRCRVSNKNIAVLRNCVACAVKYFQISVKGNLSKFLDEHTLWTISQTN